jgi:diaminohydroxyphosphoribosylaminopyrimidine deaminase / 5-amino-6-(5-phosphoribosylamino)uracil reductase
MMKSSRGETMNNGNSIEKTDISTENLMDNISADIDQFSMLSKIPYVTLSFGMSLDGKIATKTGDSKYISGSESRQFVHRLRHIHDAILVGINTVMIDHPSLTTRLEGFQGKDAHRILLDSTLKINLDERIIAQKSSANTIVVTRVSSDAIKKAALRSLGVIVVEIEDPSAPLNLHEALRKIKSLGINSILVEGGSTVHFSFIKSGLFKRLYATVSPIIIGGDLAKSAVGGEGFPTLLESARLDFIKCEKVGPDYILEAIPKNRKNIE